MPSRRILLPILSAFSLISLSGCDTLSSVPLPPNIEIVQPGPEIPAHQAAFVGKWEGSWDGRQEARLIVERVLPDNQAEVIYAWEEYWTISEDFRRFKASFDGEILEFHTGLPSTYRFLMLPDGTLEARYDWSGGFSKGVFTRAVEKAKAKAKEKAQ